MRRYVVPALIATVVLGLSAIVAGGGLRFFQERFPIWYQDLVLDRSLEAPPALGSPTPAEMERCSAALLEHKIEPVRPYFAVGVFDPRTERYGRSHYSNVLCAMGEPLLSEPRLGDARYRLLWMRSFHPDVVVRLELNQGLLNVYATQLASEYHGTPEIRMERRLEVLSLKEVTTAMADARFWQLPSSREVLGVDGSRWVLEVSEHNRYLAVSRFSGGEIEDVGRRMIRLSGLDPTPIY